MKKLKAGIIIQARTDSSRFPKKVLSKICGKPMLWHIIQRVKEMKIPIIIATTKRRIDDPIIRIAETSNVKYFRGSTKNVLDRFYKTSKEFDLDIIIRITGDCPVIDPKESIKTLKILLKNKLDFVGLDESYPDGLDTECFTFNALEKSWENAKLNSEKEHVTPHILKNENKFKIKSISTRKSYGKYRLTVDEVKDLELIKIIYEKLYGKKKFYMKDILRIMKEYPNLSKINSEIERNEGYKRSLRKDKL